MVSPPGTLILVGDDVVDLASAGRRRNEDPRFLSRVFGKEEIGIIRSSPDPALEVWRLWSAKEAAYKIGLKLDPSLVFSYRCFEVRIGRGAGRASGWVRHPDLTARVSWRMGPGWVHCVALAGPRTPRPRLLVEVQGDAEGSELPPGQDSIQGRRLAAELLSSLGAGPEVAGLSENPASGPLVSGGSQWDASISHDGRFVSSSVIEVRHELR